MRRLLWNWGPVLGWMAFIFYLSSLSTAPHLPEPLIDMLLRKVAHMAEYGVLALLVYRAQQGGILQEAESGAILAPLVVAMLYGISDEFHQGFVANRNPSPVDVGIDTVGAALALGVHRILIQRLRRSQGS